MKIKREDRIIEIHNMISHLREEESKIEREIEKDNVPLLKKKYIGKCYKVKNSRNK